jgi:hypothetical protein
MKRLASDTHAPTRKAILALLVVVAVSFGSVAVSQARVVVRAKVGPARVIVASRPALCKVVVKPARPAPAKVVVVSRPTPTTIVVKPAKPADGDHVWVPGHTVKRPGRPARWVPGHWQRVG